MHTDGGTWDEIVHILTDPAHWVAEFGAEVVFFSLILIADRLWHRYRNTSHDAHGNMSLWQRWKRHHHVR